MPKELSPSQDQDRKSSSRIQLRGELPSPGSTFDTFAPLRNCEHFQTTGAEHLGKLLPVQRISLQSGWGPPCISQYRAHDFWHNYKSTASPLYLFHGCSLGTDSDAEAVIASLKQQGSHLRYSRNSGFLFRRKAVYWSNSFEYAVMWCYFRSNGYWPQDWSQVGDFKCVVYVAKLSKDEFDNLGKIEVMRTPQDEREERQFEKWCRASAWDEFREEYAKDNLVDYHLRDDLDILVAPSLLTDRINIAGILPKDYSATNIWLFGLSEKESTEKLASYGIEIIRADYLKSETIET